MGQWIAQVEPAENPSPQPTILNLESVEAIRSAFYIQVTNERKEVTSLIKQFF